MHGPPCAGTRTGKSWSRFPVVIPLVPESSRAIKTVGVTLTPLAPREQAAPLLGTPQAPTLEQCKDFNGSKPGSFPVIPMCALSEAPQNWQICVKHFRLDKCPFSPQEKSTSSENFQLAEHGMILGHARLHFQARLDCQIQTHMTVVSLHIPVTEQPVPQANAMVSSQVAVLFPSVSEF